MELYPSHITLNGQPTTVESLIAARLSSTGWERDWLDFLAEWYEPSNYIEVKTSGSTGEPKTIRLKKDFVAASAQRTIRFFKLKEGDKVLHCLPSRFIAGKLMVVRALIGKLDLYVVDPSTNFDILRHTESLSGSVAPFKFAAMVINQVDKLWALPDWKLDFLLIGGSAIPAPLEARLQTIKTQCYSSYAMTETATHVALRKLNGLDKDDRYHCMDGVRVSISPDGCLQIHMDGLEDGSLQTNDLAELDDDRTFRIKGRVDNRIISGGLKFSPEELEKKLEGSINHPFYISSKADDRLGQKLVLVVEGKASSKVEDELKSICKQLLTNFEVPREIIFVDSLPRTENGKVKRHKF